MTFFASSLTLSQIYFWVNMLKMPQNARKTERDIFTPKQSKTVARLHYDRKGYTSQEVFKCF